MVCVHVCMRARSQVPYLHPSVLYGVCPTVGINYMRESAHNFHPSGLETVS